MVVDGHGCGNGERKLFVLGHAHLEGELLVQRHLSQDVASEVILVAGQSAAAGPIRVYEVGPGWPFPGTGAVTWPLARWAAE